MVYFRIAVIAISALGLLVYTILFDRKYFWKLLVIEVICTGFLSFYIFYTIGSYKSLDTDANLAVNASANEDGLRTITLDIKWNVMPEIFGFNGNSDLLVVRYNPELIEIVSADRAYDETEQGKTLLKLPKEYRYSQMDEKEREIGFHIEDGSDDSIKLTVRMIKPGSSLKVFFIHDYSVPLASPVFWEKVETLNI